MKHRPGQTIARVSTNCGPSEKSLTKSRAERRIEMHWATVFANEKSLKKDLTENPEKEQAGNKNYISSSTAWVTEETGTTAGFLEHPCHTRIAGFVGLLFAILY